jgi:5-methylcytosine-specific restriction endonuclease McrA
VAGNDVLAVTALGPIAGVTRVSEPLEQMPCLAGRPRSAGVAKTQDPGVSAKAAVFVRDSFTCSYCGRRTIPPDILKLLSVRFGDTFGYQKNWKPPTHRSYWDISTSVDHVVPVSAGGDWRQLTNLATACYRCQEQKSNRSLEDLGWPLRRVKGNWDGLARSYASLWSVVGRPAGDHQAWIKAFDRARSTDAQVTRVEPARERLPSARATRRPRQPLRGTKSTLAAGMFIRVALPTKQSRRSYAVLAVTSDSITLQEMWRGLSSGRWTAGQTYSVEPGALGGAENHAISAPKPDQLFDC